MKLEITRQVIRDLWPLCASGEASADSRALVNAYLATDTEFAITLEEADTMNIAMPGITLSPDAERRLLDDARARAHTKLMLIGGGIAAVVLIALIALGGVLVMFFTTS